ncbi:beta-ketoacyl-[acyl-carrier-protein] synthase family protein [Nocardia wallacei]|uniref:beta-ketoacyl-[acyl-carrier-protein] synthase family protein n=1 Tax=Nocardia wallacei TaxID=480035 RepID=UPI002454D51E|nr:beta-ketoacyl-[acyl-carrier-protein] synthase family protein [Nocardia wallacei]
MSSAEAGNGGDHVPDAGYDADRVVVTGLGPISSIGIGAAEFLRALAAGRSGARPITSFDTTGFAHSNGCEVTGFDSAPYLTEHKPGELGRATAFSVAAAAMALADAGLTVARLRELPSVIAIGTTDGESRDLDLLVESWLRAEPELLPGEVAARVPAGRLSAAVAEEFGLCDTEAVTLPTACAAGNYAIGYGCDALRSGEVEVALVGGADALCRKTFAGFYRLGTIAPRYCRPFDSARQGILTGEGAAVLVLERRDRALARGARVYAEVLGYGLNCDADHPVAPNRASVARCMALAHRNSGIAPGDVDFISAHGTGTKANDVTEAAAIREVFGAHPPPTISTKSMIGHTMGAASALAAVACCLALTHQFIPPTINHEHTDPECGGLDCVPNQARPAALRVVQNNALAFGGNNAVLVLAAPDAAGREAS